MDQDNILAIMRNIIILVLGNKNTKNVFEIDIHERNFGYFQLEVCLVV